MKSPYHKIFVGYRAAREGDIVFRLKDKDYTHSCHVTQYGYEYAEDEFLELQKATKGSNGGINIVILGDGYDQADFRWKLSERHEAGD